MTRLYGNKWSSIAVSDDGTWLDALRGLTPEQVGRGYRKMIDSGEYDWPPSAIEFRKLCIDIDENELSNYIRFVAFKGYDSYWINHQTVKTLDRMINSVRKQATAEFYNLAIAVTAKEAQLEMKGKNADKHLDELGSPVFKPSLADQS